MLVSKELFADLDVFPSRLISISYNRMMPRFNRFYFLICLNTLLEIKQITPATLRAIFSIN